jgi:hypothetical protein
MKCRCAYRQVLKYALLDELLVAWLIPCSDMWVRTGVGQGVGRGALGGEGKINRGDERGAETEPRHRYNECTQKHLQHRQAEQQQPNNPSARATIATFERTTIAVAGSTAYVQS